MDRFLCETAVTTITSFLYLSSWTEVLGTSGLNMITVDLQSSCILHVTQFSSLGVGNFSFGSVARFRSQTMVEFIDKAIEHSRSGRFLFFLHRRPTHGPTRVQLLHPVSRFRNVQSLQHLSRFDVTKAQRRVNLSCITSCFNRFVILKLVRRDQIHMLPLPRRLRDYLNTAHYYSEQLQGSQCHSP